MKRGSMDSLDQAFFFKKKNSDVPQRLLERTWNSD
jgi:hypothetical protein